MNKNKKLLQSIDVFYRLAVYGNRDVFLKSLAQSALNENIKSIVESVIKDLGTTSRPGAREVSNKLMDFLSSPTNLNDLYKLIIDASNAVPGNNMQMVQRILNNAEQIRKAMEASAPQTPQAAPTGKQAPITFQPDKIVTLPSIPVTIQKYLSEIATTEGFGLPLTKVDGKIHRETRNALNGYKQKYQLTGKSDGEVFRHIKNKYEQDYAKPVNLEPAAESQKEYQASTFRPPGT